MANGDNWELQVEYNTPDQQPQLSYAGYTETEVDDIIKKLKEQLNSVSVPTFIDIEGDLFKTERIISIRKNEA